MTNKAIETLAKIRGLWAELLPAINAIVDEKPTLVENSEKSCNGCIYNNGKLHCTFTEQYPNAISCDSDYSHWTPKTEKPLLADAKVGDRSETNSKMLLQIIETLIDERKLFGKSHPILTQNDNGFRYSYTINGQYRSDLTPHSLDITRLIPAGTLEWRQLEIAEARKKYPNLNPDLSNVRNGDKLLFSNGEIRTAVNSNGDTFLNANSPVVIGEPYSQTFLKEDGKHRQLGVMCLGILPRQYSTIEIVERMEKGLSMKANSKSLNKTLVWHDNHIWEACKDRENAYKTYTVDSRFLTATDWEEIV